jgi:hypothetical protein
MVGYVAGSSDLRRMEGLHISHSVVMNCGVALHLQSIKPTQAFRKRNLNHTHPAFLGYMQEFVY